MTVRDAFLKARGYLDEYSEDGSIIPDADVIDMQLKAIQLADTAQKKVYRFARLNETKALPKRITDIDQEFEINDIGVEAVSLFIASKLAPFENQNLVNYFEEEYNKAVRDIKGLCPAIITDPVDIYGGDE